MKEIKEALFYACQEDNYGEVEKILSKNNDINLDTPLLPPTSRRNGTALIFAGNAKIGKLLIDNGAEINFIYKNDIASFTALDSAENTFIKMNDSHKDKAMLKEYIAFLKNTGAKTYKELQGNK